MSKLLVKFPSRNRPEKFRNILDDYTSRTSGKHDVRFVITMDFDDETMNNDEIKNYLESLKSNGIDLVYHYGNSKTKVEACNANLDGESADVILLISDDMALQQDNYDDIILSDFAKYLPDYDGGIKYHDGLRDDVLMTLPVIGWKFYEKYGYIYNPEYTSVYCDTEQTNVLMLLNKLAVSTTCIAKHEWTSQPFDELHARNENAQMYQKDGEIFYRNQSMNFNV
jgi:hypothetical protein|tara:strand:+ start:49 stop:723 length:675 start_codon:yes stop_codon:yes gene_type:complete